MNIERLSQCAPKSPATTISGPDNVKQLLSMHNTPNNNAQTTLISAITIFSWPGYKWTTLGRNVLHPIYHWPIQLSFNKNITNMSSIPFLTEPSQAEFEDVTADNLLESLESLAAGNIPDSLRNNEEKRLRFLEAARMASLKLEQPWDTMQRLIFCALPPNIVQAGIDLGLWKLLAQSEGAMSVNELAVQLGAESELLVRLLRTERNIATYNAIPKWLAENSYKAPKDNKHLPFNLGKNTDLHFFEWLSQRPKHQHAFNEYMSFQRVGQNSWLDVFPLEKMLKNSSTGNEHRTLFVDVGGGYGHQCKEVLRRMPWLQERIVLQDTHRAAIDSAKEIKDLKVVYHDFNNPQPVKGARIYYLRNILHDWPDHACLDILSHLKDVMAPDSVILLDELVLQDEGAHWYGASFDLLMMANYGARERSLGEWDRLLEKVGLERKTFVPYSMQGDAVQVVGPRGTVHERL
ncbi:O-methyl transferase B [Pyrenophora seminiperda CCB06]|uniref:O-methyl transferase B n=1 Tax=Pyrenophora seminiperda CCB06 TaxID=1302712 RepID=A0A3M7M0N4_9PLEO|nr:O-methyl transferase B [Pyrenophora seminiperda CCB06]